MIKKDGGVGYSFVVDVSDYKQVEDAAFKVRREIGEVYMLINNAGILNALPLVHLTQNMIEKTMRINLLAHFWTTKVFLPRMISEGKGHIVAISSNCGLYGKSYFTDYS
jgi:short-chain dehydrogenase, putative